MQASKQPDTMEGLASQVDRILASGAFRNSEALKRLLRFLADKTLAGEAGQLKEYTVGLDVVGKPASYDPRNDSTVRIQAGRLRQKLNQYYREEGKTDAWIVDLPKGQFGLVCVPAPRPVEEPQEPASTVASAGNAASPFLVRTLLAVLAAVTGLTVYLGISLWEERKSSREFQGSWTADVNELWRVFLNERRPLLVSVLDHPMAAIDGFGGYTDLSINDWETLAASPVVADLRKRYGKKDLQRLYYTSRGDLDTYFHLGRLLGPRIPVLSLLRTRDVSWQQMADNNVLFLGSQEFYEGMFAGVPADLDFRFDKRGFRNLRPQTGEPELFADRPPTQIGENGESFALVTNLPGPRELGVVRAFSANRSAARLGAIRAFTEGHYASLLLAKLRKPSGELPPYYQILLHVKYNGSVPTDVSYVTHHELAAKSQLARE